MKKGTRPSTRPDAPLVGVAADGQNFSLRVIRDGDISVNRTNPNTDELDPRFARAKEEGLDAVLLQESVDGDSRRLEYARVTGWEGEVTRDSARAAVIATLRDEFENPDKLLQLLAKRSGSNWFLEEAA